MAYAPANDLGTLKIIPEANRPSTYLINGYATFGFGWVDVDCSSIVPKGTKAVMLFLTMVFTGDGTTDAVYSFFRKNGSSATAEQQLPYIINQLTNLGAGISVQQTSLIVVELDTSGIFEHSQLRRSGGGAATGSLSAIPIGYYL